MIHNMNRRIFLRGLGGAVVAAPFLSSVWERAAKAQSAPSGAPRRLIIMFTHYGCLTNKWFPNKINGPLTAEDLMPTSLSALAPFASKLLMPRGIRNMNEWTANNRGAGRGRGQGNDSHTQVVGSFFTCQPVTPNSNDPFSFEMATKFQAKPIGPSLDHVIAQQISPEGTPLLINTGGRTDNSQSAISYIKAETQYAGLTASQALDSITNLFRQGAPMMPDTYAAIRGKKITDLVKADLAALKSLDMSQADKLKLQAWEALLNDVGDVAVTAQCNADLAAMLGATDENRRKLSGSGFGADVLTTRITDTMDGADFCSAVAALAAACNANPMIVLKYPGNYVFRGLDITTESHSVSHRLDNAGMQGTCLPNAVNYIEKIDRYYAQKFANLVKMLDSMSEGDGTVLDNSAVVWFNEMSDGNAHNHNNAPIIQAGSLGGYFKTGQVINVDQAAADKPLEQWLGRSLSQCTEGTTNMANGVNQGTGTVPEIGNAPINKYFCNLMNALGVKAGSDGFPQAGGAEEVTRFGMYDRTEDFIGGGTNPPMIRSPGEFIQLKADA